MKSFLDNSAGYLINMTALLLKRELNSAIKSKKIDLTTEQWAILNRLNENSALTQKEVAKITFKDNANITRIVDKLEKKGLIERLADPNDRRAWKISITKEGKNIRNQIEPLAIEVLKKATNGLTNKQVDDFNRTSNVILKNLMK
ncbi:MULTISPECIES: MarR family winged helix-turn-helix transcriptional regulator [unclassified Tenacibaculum]|uniref:MarR family winged helix-turn-helix transcriptional regulator n=1 Tax=unclassified Tenacibaculum TaxID=2635139 RepID=UPI001F27E39C|nr:MULTISPECIES: MarR family transcriptional regulator [unclassified Tenacibaculum]MCF2875749.1 MarR family transcriptional regulator [Tenacibaculum sp. Cn5-1]MCF2935825.1 MarR family transcriptional regulator [Tenacibaculum sp. Cn5-34]MCG7512385.1 MarR family transcriptional regulator [Tenacibaculum sp. Cn5-46]